MSNEQPLPDNYPCHYGYLYVVGDRVFQNWPNFPTVSVMRDALVTAKLEPPGVVIKNCDIKERNLWELMI